MIRYKFVHLLLLCSLLFALPAPVLASTAPASTSGVDLTVTVTASPAGIFPAQVTVYLSYASGGGDQQIVVTPSSPTATFTNLYRNRLYKIQAVPGQSRGAFPSQAVQVLTPAVGAPDNQTLQLSDTPPISGHVMKPDASAGEPATVKVFNATCTQEQFSVGTSSLGYYELSLRDGAYCLQAEALDTVHYNDSSFKPVVSSAANAQSIDLLLKAKGMNTIQGQATTDENPSRPVQNARITATKLGTSEAVSTTTNTEGNYSLQVPAAAATWLVKAEVTENTQPGGLTAPPLPKQVTFVSNEIVTVTRDFTFTVPSGDAHIAGTVMITGTVPIVPTFPVTVTAFNVQESFFDSIAPDDGSFDLSVSGKRNYLVGVQGTVVRGPDGSVYTNVNPQWVHVDNGEIKDIGILWLKQIEWPNLSTISGSVLTTEGEPANVRVIGINLSTQTPTAPASTDEQGNFTLYVNPGTWWVAVSLAEEDAYLPYRLQWQKIVTVEAGQDVTGVQLTVRKADATIHGTLTRGEGGPLASDACGVVAAYKKGEPDTYNFATIEGGIFDLAVITGTYRLEVIPNPSLEAVQNLLPEDCEAGKYLPATVAKVEVTTTGVTEVTIPLQSSMATIHGQLWDRFQDEAVSGWGGVLLGWNPALKTWSATQIDKASGRGDLRATSGEWLLKFRINPDSGYRELPSLVHATVPEGETDVEVHLPVMKVANPVPGHVLDPDGNAVKWVLVRAVGVPGNASDITDKTGAFTLTLTSGAYLVEVLGPAELLTDNDWISPAPQKLLLLPNTPPPTLTLQYRRGDADIHGSLIFSGTLASAIGDKRALITGMARGGHSKSWVNMPLAPGEEYHLPALKGQKWLVSASYWDGEQLW
ncbi:MAG: carboxypeptidase regulatory-like domain-containing protein, partial [Chloroflexi bacterium]|nr:carboxypeptidase regulatory-like domain-containing protein [Chloroflexota bacterium]